MTKPHIVYRYEDAELIKARHIEMYNGLINSGKFSDEEVKEMKETIRELIHTTAEDFYDDVTFDYEHDSNKNAISSENPKGKYSFFQNAKLFSVPFITKDGREVFTAKKHEVDWDRMHLNNQQVYADAWDMVMNNKKPETEEQKIIYENMKNRTAYFSSFNTKENYIIMNTAFWGYAFVDKNGWYELEDNMDQFKWVSKFYDNFIKPLDDNTQLTIFECKK